MELQDPFLQFEREVGTGDAGLLLELCGQQDLGTQLMNFMRWILRSRFIDTPLDHEPLDDLHQVMTRAMFQNAAFFAIKMLMRAVSENVTSKGRSFAEQMLRGKVGPRQEVLLQQTAW